MAFAASLLAASAGCAREPQVQPATKAPEPPPPAPAPAPPPPPDADADGVIDDGTDKCVAEKEDGLAPDAKDGCKSTDPDGDGFLAEADKCPDQAEVKNNYKDDDGCPDVPRVVVEKGEVKLNEKVAFVAGKAELDPASQELLANIAQVIKENPQIEFVEVAAYSEKVGSDAATVTLTKKRADAVVKALVSLGVEKNRLRGAGYGAHCAFDAGETEEAKEKNRRVEIKIMRFEGKDTGVELACAAAVTKGLKPAGVPATAPKGAPKGSDPKPVDAKPAAATQPAGAKPADAKPAAAKPAEAKPAAAATKPAEAKPADATKPAEAKPAEVMKPAAPKAAETKPASVK
ncbi:OmpA family protein [Sorangium sp. So ce131]|uniref:OmpA family protein n=1 Tax=Sorangium sp. So ce131 TaxID=3133282 RepID=UPI003F609E13